MPGPIPDHRPSGPAPSQAGTTAPKGGIQRAKRTEPTRLATDQAAGFKYTPSHKTDLAKKFKAMQQTQARREKAAAAIDPRQQGLDLDVPAGHARIVPLKKRGAST